MKTTPLRIKGHALSHSRTGVQSLMAVGHCKCGWRKTEPNRENVVHAYRAHLYAVARAIAKATS